MDNKQLKEWADLMGVSVEDAKKLREKGENARKRDNRFESKAGEGRFIQPKGEK